MSSSLPVVLFERVVHRPPTRKDDRAVELLDRLLAQSISLDEFLVSARSTGLTREEAAAAARASAALPTPGARLAADTQPGASSRIGGTLRVGLWTQPEGLDPALATTRTSRLLTEQLYTTLTAIDADGRPYPELAEWIELSDDRCSYTFGIRMGTRFHDGSEVTAEDVAFSLERLIELGTEYHFDPWTVTMRAATVVDRYTVRLDLSQPTGPMLTWLGFCGSGIVPKAAVTAGHDLDRAPIGSGPFRLARGRLGRNGLAGPIRLVRHSNGVRRPRLGALEFVTIADDAERAAALADGRIDLDALMSPGGWSTAAANPDLVAISTPDGRWHWLMVNCRDPVLSDVRVRRAISMAIDRQALLDEVFAGQGEPLLSGVIAPWSWASAPDLVPFGPRGAPDEARSLLSKAGIGDRETLEIAALDTLPIACREAELIAKQLRRVGLSVVVRVLTAEEWGKTVRRDGPFQLATTYWGSPINDPDDFVYMAYRSGARYDTGSCGSEALDEMLEQARGSIDQSERAAAYHRIQAIALDQVPLIPTIQPPVLRGHTARLRGLVPMRNAQLRTLSDAWLDR